jgi:hypothetical protein
MSLLVDELRPFWLTGLHKVTGHQTGGLAGLFAAQKYQIYSAVTAKSVVLHFADWDTVARAFAGDCARMSNAALESVEDLRPSQSLPKSLGWCLVRSYYAAFFGAHAIERMLGRSISQVDGSSSAAINSIASAFGMLPVGVNFTRGTYVCVADPKAMTLGLYKTGVDGSHEALWQDFSKLLRDTANNILSAQLLGRSAQSAAAKLTELDAALRGGGALAGGSWLSFMRNRINYQHAFGVWYPYREWARYYAGLYPRVRTWQDDPSTFSIWPGGGREVQRYIETSMMIVALCREMCSDMALRCPQGRSFHDYASLALVRQLSRHEDVVTP